ncbi:hypothetical protein DS742_14160 [Lacrimispora amygdalina]|uniref:Uncharacterized protein n=1 Tax=Lacrimispora amygdalina TaxID=253257 RepID=A0A3E2NB87_9FIRM|nr:hypothetical protein [Clostridium indicum]RFZ78253.1 hypothetical protein DS742_14160 [Clostridium indicum]
MNKYNTSNCLPSFAKMKKSFPALTENKKEFTNNKKYLYDFSLLDGKIPADIAESIFNQAMKQTGIIDCFSVCDAISGIEGKKYYVYLDFIPYKVINMNTGKTSYCIMEVSGLRISVHNLNVYGYAENIQADYIEAGHWRTNTLTYINDIEVA